MSLNRLNVQGWTSETQFRLDRRSYSFGQKWDMPIPLGEVLPFTIFRDRTNNPISVAELVSENGTVTDISASFIPQIDIIPGPVKDQIKYLGNAPIAGSFDEGLYVIRISDGVTTWETEWFVWTADSDKLMKLEWWHFEPIQTQQGVITYGNGYRWRCYLKTELFKPSYEFAEEVDNRNTIPFVNRSTTYKEYRTTAILPEFFIDAIRLAAIHSSRVVTFMGVEYKMDTFRMQNPEWIDRADLALVEFRFRTGTIATSYGASLVNDSGIQNQACLPVDFTAVRFLLDRFGALTVPGELANTIDGNTPGYILYSDDGADGADLFYVPGSGNPPDFVQYDQGAVIYNQEDGSYYIATAINGGSLLTPRILGIGSAPQYTLTGLALPGTIIQVEYRTLTESWQRLPTGYTSAQIQSGIDIGPLGADNWTEVRLVMSTSNCGVIFTTDRVILAVDGSPIGGIGYWTIGDDFIPE